MFADLKEKVEGTSGLLWRSPGRWEMGAMLTAVGLEKRRADEVSSTLFAGHGIVVRPFPAEGLNSLRVSPNLMNTQQELDRLLNLLEEMER